MKCSLSGKAALAFSSVAIAAAIIGGMVVIGPPSYQRALKVDEQRILHLNVIARTVNRYYASHKTLPTDLRELANTNAQHLTFNDPVSGQPYEYIRKPDVAAASYTLCANFKYARGKNGDAPERKDAEAFFIVSSPFWDHAAGRHCFEIKAGE